MVFEYTFLADGSPNIGSIETALSKYLKMVRKCIGDVEEPSLFTCLTILEDDLVELTEECATLHSSTEDQDIENSKIESIECRLLTICEELNDLLNHNLACKESLH